MALSLTLTIAGGNPSVGDVARAFEVDVGEDITDREVYELLFKKPSGAASTQAATLSGTQVLAFTTPAGFFDESGVWEIQARVMDTTPNPDKVEKSTIGSFYVGRLLA